MTETQIKASVPRTKRQERAFRLVRRGLDGNLPAVLTDRGPVSRAQILDRANSLVSWLSVLPEGPVHLALPTRGELLVGLLGCWFAGREVILGSRPALAGRTDELRVTPGELTLREVPTDTGKVGSAPGGGPLAAHLTLATLVTSGSTGQPQKHQKTAAHLLGEAEMLVKLLSLSSESVVFPTVAGHHLYGLLFGLLAPWLSGATIDDSSASLPERFHPDAVAARMHAIGATHWISVPAHLSTFAERGISLLGLREIVSSAAVLGGECAAKIESLTGARVRDILGSTETGGIASRQTSRQEHWVPFDPVRVLVSDAGLMLVDSPFSSLSVDHPTGDQIEMLGDGTFRHLGRRDGIVKLGGRRVALRQVEEAALSIPGVVDAAAIHEVTEDLRGGRLWLFVATELSVVDLRTQLRRRLDAAAVPRRIRVLAHLPRDERGKLPQRAIEQLLRERAG